MNLNSTSTYVSYQTHFHININFVMLIHGDIDNIAGQPFWLLAAILDSGSSGTCVPWFFRCIIILRTYSEKCLLVSRYWLHLYRTKSLMSKIDQFFTDILNFGGHLDFLFTQNSYIWILCSYSIYFDMNTNFIAQRQGDIDNIIDCRQPFWVLAAILDSGWVTTCVPGFFWSYIYCQHILKISCWLRSEI